jgi:hypothetical protein
MQDEYEQLNFWKSKPLPVFEMCFEANGGIESISFTSKPLFGIPFVSAKDLSKKEKKEIEKLIRGNGRH